MTDLLAWALAYLEHDEDIIVPLKKLWLTWGAEHEAPPFAEFVAQVLADPRVEEMPGVNHAEGLDAWTPEAVAQYEQEMEAQGYFSGPRVKLRARPITLDHVVKMITRHNDRMEESLRQARAAMPAEVDEQQEGLLIDVIFKARELRRHLREAGLDEGRAEEGEEE